MFDFFRFHSQISLAVISVRINEWFVISKNEFNYCNSIELQIFEKKKKNRKEIGRMSGGNILAVLQNLRRPFF